MEPQTYALLDSEHGWLINLVRWDGDLGKWQPPAGTRAVLASQVDFTTLPESPDQP